MDHPGTSARTGNPVLDRISRVYATLSRSERQVADYVLSNPITFTRTSISGISARCGASAPTILRFCRAAGYDGLTDLKLSMVAVLGQAAQIAMPGEPDGLGAGLLDTAGELVDRLRQQMRGDRVMEAMALLAAAPGVTCMASHHLQQAAAYARDCLLRHDVQALTPASPAYPGAPAPAMHSASLGLFFCFGVPDAALVDAIARYHRYGNGAIVISNVAIAPFAEASVHLVVGPKQTHAAALRAAHLLPHLLMTDLLVDGSTRQRDAVAQARAGAADVPDVRLQ